MDLFQRAFPPPSYPGRGLGVRREVGPLTAGQLRFTTTRPRAEPKSTRQPGRLAGGLTEGQSNAIVAALGNADYKFPARIAQVSSIVNAAMVEKYAAALAAKTQADSAAAIATGRAAQAEQRTTELRGRLDASEAKVREQEIELQQALRRLESGGTAENVNKYRTQLLNYMLLVFGNAAYDIHVSTIVDIRALTAETLTDNLNTIVKNANRAVNTLLAGFTQSVRENLGESMDAGIQTFTAAVQNESTFTTMAEQATRQAKEWLRSNSGESYNGLWPTTMEDSASQVASQLVPPGQAELTAQFRTIFNTTNI